MGKGFSVYNLEKIRKFYNIFQNSETLSRKFKLVALFRISKSGWRRKEKFWIKWKKLKWRKYV